MSDPPAFRGDSVASMRAVALGSLRWSGRGLARLVDVCSREQERRAAHRSDWWIYGVPALAFLHLALLLTLRLRPGRFGVVLWRWGPATLAGLAVLFLLAAFLSARLTRRTWNARRLAGYVGLGLVVGCQGLYRSYPSSHDQMPSRVRFDLPLEGPVTVAWGGESAAVNYHVAAPAERWAYDLLTTENGRSYRGAGRQLTDYYVYGRPVRAPASGRVLAVHDGDPDIPARRLKRGRGVGNHVILEVAPSEFLLLAHFRPGSIAVAPGENVTAGQIVGLVGNSGNTSEPHVHLHLQDTPAPDAGEGIPFFFSDYLSVATGEPVERGMPQGGIQRGRFVGDVIESRAPARPTALSSH